MFLEQVYISSYVLVDIFNIVVGTYSRLALGLKFV